MQQDIIVAYNYNPEEKEPDYEYMLVNQQELKQFRTEYKEYWNKVEQGIIEHDMYSYFEGKYTATMYWEDFAESLGEKSYSFIILNHC